MSKQTTVTIVLVIALAISMTFNVVLWTNRPNEQPNIFETETETQSTTADKTEAETKPTSETKTEKEPTVESKIETESENETGDGAADTTTTIRTKDTTGIETPYGVLQPPVKFPDMQHSILDKDGVFTCAFSYIRGEETIELFAVHFGDETRGTLIGHVMEKEKPVAFTVTSTVFNPDDVWPDEEIEQFNAMLMSINDVIESVQLWDNYID